MSLFSLTGKDSSLQSSALLTPPETPTTPKDTPFKPKDGDNVSLSMKRGHKERQRDDEIIDPRECLSNNDLRSSYNSKQRHLHRRYSKSLPHLRGSKTFPSSKVTPSSVLARSRTSDRTRRRWTLSTKAPSTISLAPNVSTVPLQKQAKRAKKKYASKDKENDSPAMITLRRATNKKESTRKTSLTFFPEPTFQRNKSGFLSSFLNTIAGTEEKAQASVAEAHQQGPQRPSRSASVDSGKAQPASSESAAPVCTEVAGVAPSWSIPGRVSQETKPRRCSTRFITAGSVYEVIWDEDGSSTSFESPPLPPQVEPEPESNSTERRRSVAVDNLEWQLLKAVAQSRRESVAAQVQASVVPAQGGYHSGVRQQSLGELLTFKFAQQATDAFAHHIPFSNGPKRTSGASHRCMVVPEEGVGYTQSPCPIESFPPLWSRAASNGSGGHSSVAAHVSGITSASASTSSRPSKSGGNSSPDKDNRRLASQSSGLGNMVGVSAHMRRRSTVPDDWYGRRRSNAMNGLASRRSSAFQAKNKAYGDPQDDTVPLISRQQQ